METRFWVDHCLRIFKKAEKEGLLKNQRVLNDCWKWLIVNKVLFYCTFEEFKKSFKNKENLDDVKGILFGAYRLNLPILVKWIKINSNMLAVGRFKIRDNLISTAGNSVHNNSPVRLKKDREVALEEEDDYLELFDIDTESVEKELSKIHISIEERFFKNWNYINKVEAFANNNPYNTKQKEPFKYILNYYFNVEKLLHNDKYWLVFEKEYMNILITNLQNEEMDREFSVKVGNLINKYEMEDFLEILEEEENDEISEILWDMEDELLDADSNEEIEEYNKLLELAIKDKDKADAELQKYFK